MRESRPPNPSSFKPGSPTPSALLLQTLEFCWSSSSFPGTQIYGLPGPPPPEGLARGCGLLRPRWGVTGCPSGTLPSCLSFLRQAPPPQAPPPSLPTRGQGDPDAGIPGEEARRLLPGAHSSAPPAAPGAAAAPPPARRLQGRPLAHRLLAAQAPEGPGRGRGRGGARRRRRGRGIPPSTHVQRPRKPGLASSALRPPQSQEARRQHPPLPPSDPGVRVPNPSSPGSRSPGPPDPSSRRLRSLGPRSSLLLQTQESGPPSPFFLSSSCLLPQTQESGPEIPLRSFASEVSIPGQIPTLCSHPQLSRELQARH